MSLLSGSKHWDNCPSCQSELQSQRGEGDSLDFCRKCRFPLMLVANKYRLVNKLSEGGFAILYGAEHIHLERDARRVIKVIKPEYLSNENMRTRFVREVQVTSALSQRNNHIVRIYDDFGEISNLGYFYIMEHLEGQPLNEMLDDVNGLLPLNLCYHLFLQLCDAMREAHKTSIVHRDLKPHNILIVEQGRDSNFLKVIDFGIAKPIGNQPDQAQVTQGILGTPAYMSPEQCVNKNVSAGSDIYAMGIILYEMLVGETPFVPRDPKKQEDLSVMEIMSAHLNTQPPPLQSKLPPHRKIPWQLEEVVQCALAKRPEDRFLSVEEMEQAFFNVLPDLRPTGAYITGAHTELQDVSALSIRSSQASTGDTVREIPVINQGGFPPIQQPQQDAPQTPNSAFEQSLFASQDLNNYQSFYDQDGGETEVAIQTVGSVRDQASFLQDQEPNSLLHSRDPNSFLHNQEQHSFLRDQIDLGSMHPDVDAPPASPSRQDFQRKVIEIDRRQEPQPSIPLPTPPLFPPESYSSLQISGLSETPHVERGSNPGIQRASDPYQRASDPYIPFQSQSLSQSPPERIAAPSSPPGQLPLRSEPSTGHRPRQPRTAIRSALREPETSTNRMIYIWFSLIFVLSILLIFFTRSTWQPWFTGEKTQKQQPKQRLELPVPPRVRSTTPPKPNLGQTPKPSPQKSPGQTPKPSPRKSPADDIKEI